MPDDQVTINTRPMNPAEALTLLSDPAEPLKTEPFFDKGTQDDGLFTDESSGSDHARTHRARLLAEAIPATTNAAGRFEVVTLLANNINMQAVFQSKGWPEERPRENDWLHNDLRVVAYPYVHRLFENLVNESESGGQ